MGVGLGDGEMPKWPYSTQPTPTSPHGLVVAEQKAIAAASLDPRVSYASTVSTFLDAQGRPTPNHFLINDMTTTCDLIRSIIGPQTHIKATREARPQWSDRTIERYLDDTVKKDDGLFTGCRVLCTVLVDSHTISLWGAGIGQKLAARGPG